MISLLLRLVSLIHPQEVFFWFMPNSSPISKFNLLLVQVLRLPLNLPMVFAWSVCWSLLPVQWDVVGLSDEKILI